MHPTPCSAMMADNCLLPRPPPAHVPLAVSLPAAVSVLVAASASASAVVSLCVAVSLCSRVRGSLVWMSAPWPEQAPRQGRQLLSVLLSVPLSVPLLVESLCEERRFGGWRRLWSGSSDSRGA